MDSSIVVAVISAIVSAGGAIWSLSTAQQVRSSQLRAEEQAKRTEIVRIKALEATDQFLIEMTSLIKAVDTFRFLISNNADISAESNIKQLSNVASARTRVLDLRYRFAPYVAEDLIKYIDEVVLSTESVEFNEPSLKASSDRLKLVALKVASDARNRYLGEIK